MPKLKLLVRNQSDSFISVRNVPVLMEAHEYYRKTKKIAVNNVVTVPTELLKEIYDYLKRPVPEKIDDYFIKVYYDSRNVLYILRPSGAKKKTEQAIDKFAEKRSKENFERLAEKLK